MPFASRRIVSAVFPGIQATSYGTDAYVSQVFDAAARNVLALSDNGKYSFDFTQLAPGGSFTIPLPQTYQTGVANLLAAITSTQTCKLTIVQPVIGSSALMLRAGLSLTDQPGICTFCGPVTSLTLLNSSAALANVEWSLVELPAIGTNAGWRDGAISTGLVGP